MNRKHFAFASILIAAVMVLSSCAPAASVPGTGETTTPAATTAATSTLYMNLGAGDIPTIDPALTTDSSSVQIVEETFVGLTRLNEENVEVVPGMATTWDISDDGKTITFHLRNDVPWVKWDATQGKVVQVMDCDGNPRMVTADDFVYGTLRTLDPATASDYAYVLGFALEGATGYNEGTINDASQVGIKAIDPQTVEMTFVSPAAYNINIAGMWVAFAQPKWLIEGDDCTDARGQRWTETGFFQGYGPYVMQEWVHDSYLTMVKNPFWPGSTDIPVPTIDVVNWSMLDTPPAFAEYEAGNMDVSNVPLSDMDRVKSDPVLSQELHIAPSLSSYYYGFNTKADIVSDVRVRKALSMAVDRQSLIDNVLKGGQEPAQWFCRPGLVACPTIANYPDLGIKYDPEQAKTLLQEYLDETEQTAAGLDITLMYNTSEGHQRIAEAIQGMWSDTLGINVNLTNQEWKVFLQTIKGADTPQIYRSGWSMDYPDANNFDKDVVAPGGNDNPTNAEGVPEGGLQWVNDQFVKLVDDAAVEQNPDTRIQMYAQAEDILVNQDAAIIPIYWYTTVAVTKPYVTRTYSPTGTQHIEKWSLNR